MTPVEEAALVARIRHTPALRTRWTARRTGTFATWIPWIERPGRDIHTHYIPYPATYDLLDQVLRRKAQDGVRCDEVLICMRETLALALDRDDYWGYDVRRTEQDRNASI